MIQAEHKGMAWQSYLGLVPLCMHFRARAIPPYGYLVEQMSSGPNQLLSINCEDLLPKSHCNLHCAVCKTGNTGNTALCLAPIYGW